MISLLLWKYIAKTFNTILTTRLHTLVFTWIVKDNFDVSHEKLSYELEHERMGAANII